MDLIFIKILGVALIIGLVYGFLKKIGFTTFLKGLCGLAILIFLGYCALSVLPKVISWVLPWFGVIIVLFVLFFLCKLIRR